MMTTNGSSSNGTSGAKQTAALTVRDESRAFEANDLHGAIEVARMAAGSKIFKGVASPEAAFVVIATGRELGLTAMQSLRGIHMIEGKPSVSADAAMAIVLKHPACESFRMVTSDNTAATYEAKRHGSPPQRMSFTIQDAATAGLSGKDNWRRFPAAMLRARCGLALARAVFPDALMGVYDPDELDRAAPVPVEMTATPAAPDSRPAVTAVEEPTDADREAQFVDRIAKASDVPALSRVGVAISRARLGDAAKGALRALYNARKLALSSPPAHDAETGELDAHGYPANEADAEAQASAFDT